MRAETYYPHALTERDAIAWKFGKITSEVKLEYYLNQQARRLPVDKSAYHLYIPMVVERWQRQICLWKFWDETMLNHKTFGHVVRFHYLAFSDLLQRWPLPFRLTQRSKHGGIRRCPRKATLPTVHRVSCLDH